MKSNLLRVVSKTPVGAPFFPNSSISPIVPSNLMLYQVVFCFEQKQEHRHPDDNFLQLICTPEMYEYLRVGMLGIAIWEKKKLISFEEKK